MFQKSLQPKKKFLSDFKTKVSNAENNWEGKQINHSLSKT